MPFHGAIHALPQAALRAFLAAYAPDLAARAKTRAALLAVVDDERALPRDLLRALVLLGALATPRGRRDVEAAAAISAFDLGSASRGESPAELLARLLVAAVTSRAARAVVRRAKRHVERRPPEAPTRELALAEGRAWTAPDLSPRARARFAKELAAWLEAHHREPHVTIRSGFYRGAPSLLVVRADARVESPAWIDGEIGSLAHVPAAFDVLAFDEARARLRVTTADPPMVAVYRVLAGRVFVGDDAAFSSGPTVALRRLLTLGAAALDASRFRASIARVRLIHVLWDRGENDVEILRGGDVFAAIERRGAPLGVGEFLSAVLRIDFAGEGAGHADVWLKPPHRVTWEPSPHDDVVVAWLSLAGLLSAPSEKGDLVAASRVSQSLDTWRADFSPAVVDAWLAAGVLAKSETRIVADPAQPSRARALLTFPDEDDLHHAIPEDDDDDAEPRLVDRAALEAYSIDHAALANDVATRIATALGEPHAPAVAIVDARENVFDLGPHQVGAARFHLLLATGAIDAAAWEGRLRAASDPLPPLVLVPERHAKKSKIPTAPLPLPGDLPRAVARDIARALGARAGVPVHLVAPEGARVAVDLARREAYLDGVELTKLTDQLFDYLVLLARASGAAVPTETINKEFGRHRGDSETAKQLKKRLLEAIRSSFEESRVALPHDLGDLVVHVARGGYKLAFGVYVR